MTWSAAISSLSEETLMEEMAMETQVMTSLRGTT